MMGNEKLELLQEIEELEEKADSLKKRLTNADKLLYEISEIHASYIRGDGLDCCKYMKDIRWKLDERWKKRG